MSPTRYGLDMGIVVGSAAGLMQQSSYKPGCKGCLGACHFGPSCTGRSTDDELVAAGEESDGNAIIEIDGERADEVKQIIANSSGLPWTNWHWSLVICNWSFIFI